MKLQENSLGFLLKDVSRLMRRAFQQQLEGSSCLTLAQARVLVHVARHEGIRQVDLAELLEIQPITLARQLDQLAQEGLVERRPAPNDRRAYLIYLTEAATPHLEAIQHVGSIVQTMALRGLDTQQAELVLMALSKIRENLGSG